MARLITSLVELELSCCFKGVQLDIDEGSIVLQNVDTNVYLYAGEEAQCCVLVSGGVASLKFVYQGNTLLSIGVPELSVNYANKMATITSRKFAPLTLSFSSRLFQSALANNFGKILKLAQTIAD